MKTLQDITVSLDLAKELKKLGFPQDTYFYWSKNMDLKNWKIENRQFYKIDKRSDMSAPTTEELLEWLPDIVRGRNAWIMGRYKEHFIIKYTNKDNELDSIQTTGIGLANCLAEMVIYLAKNKIIKFER